MSRGRSILSRPSFACGSPFGSPDQPSGGSLFSVQARVGLWLPFRFACSAKKGRIAFLCPGKSGPVASLSGCLLSQKKAVQTLLPTGMLPVSEKSDKLFRPIYRRECCRRPEGLLWNKFKRTGVRLTMQASPDFTNLGASSKRLPDLLSTFSISSTNLQAM